MMFYFFFFQAEDGIRDLVRSRGLGDVYKRQATGFGHGFQLGSLALAQHERAFAQVLEVVMGHHLSLIHI